VKTVLIIGGYGGFGGRLARRLARDGLRVLVGGRSLAKAMAFCAVEANCHPLKIDRAGDLAAALARERPDVVIDAAGPFQRSDDRLIEACIAAQIDYLDLADARDFVARIGRYDAAAKAAGVAIIAGASSVPALSGAVVRQLANGIDRASAIEIAISASSRAAAGTSVARAILGGVGQPLKSFAGRRWQTIYGWQSLRREVFAIGTQSLGSRLVATTDVPDLDLLTRRYPHLSSVQFRAGTESTMANLSLWLASWPVRWAWVPGLGALARWLGPAQRLTQLWGGDRSGMVVRMFGWSRGRRIEQRWTLIASGGDGPEIPTLAAAILVERMISSKVLPGARDAGSELELGEFEPLFDTLAIQHRETVIEQPSPLYARVMGARFATLAPALRSVHGVLRDSGREGRASVGRGTGPISRLVATLMRFPPAGNYPLHVHFREADGIERWNRDFGGHRFSSVLSARGDRLVERFGPLRFEFELPVEAGGLTMVMRRWSFAGVPLPLALAPRSPAREWEEEGRFNFDVPIDLPMVGRIVHYRGWLEAGADGEP
jgi:hypothetical protein